MTTKEDYIIRSVKNNLSEITLSLKILLILFVLSIFILFADVSSLHDEYKVALLAIFGYLYLILVYNLYEVIQILNIFVGDLKSFKNDIYNLNEIVK